MTGADWERLGERADELTEWTERHAFLRMRGERCIALEVTATSVRCTIYERRPEVCRTLERGGGACAVERERRLPVLRSR